MKHAVISDIHGNLPALRAVLDDAAAGGADSYIFLGDYCCDLPWYGEIMDFVRRFGGGRVIRGNKEDYLESLISRDPGTWTDGQMRAIYHTFDSLSPDDITYLASLPAELIFDSGHEYIRCFHSHSHLFRDTALDRFSSFWYAQEMKEKPFNHSEFLAYVDEILLADKKLSGILGDLHSGLYLFGHSHVQWHCRIGDKTLVNAGSCGLALDWDCTAAYTLVEYMHGEWQIEERRVAYDTDAAARALRESQLYSRAEIWSGLILRELLYARESVHFFLAHAARYAGSIGDSERPYSLETWEAAYQCWQPESDTEKLLINSPRQ